MSKHIKGRLPPASDVAPASSWLIVKVNYLLKFNFSVDLVNAARDVPVRRRVKFTIFRFLATDALHLNHRTGSGGREVFVDS
jgi:hypothetical protein